MCKAEQQAGLLQAVQSLSACCQGPCVRLMDQMQLAVLSLHISAETSTTGINVGHEATSDHCWSPACACAAAVQA